MFALQLPVYCYVGECIRLTGDNDADSLLKKLSGSHLLWEIWVKAEIANGLNPGTYALYMYMRPGRTQTGINQDKMFSDPGRGLPPYKNGRDACGKFEIKPLKETNLGTAQVFFLPLKETILKHREIKNTVTFNDGKDIII